MNSNSKKNALTGVSGRLEDLSLLDMLQVVAFSERTGYLLIDSKEGEGGVILREGRVVCAFSHSTLGLLHLISGGQQPRSLEETIQELIELAIQELLRLTDGGFRFQLVDDLEPAVAGADISCFLERPGLDAQNLLLRVAKAADRDRLETKDLLSAADSPMQNADETRESESCDDPEAFEESRQAADPTAAREKSLGHSPEMRRYLSESTSKLLNQESGADISKNLLELSHRFFDRCLLFLVKQDEFCCLDLLVGSRAPGSKVQAGELNFAMDSVPVFARTVAEAKQQYLTPSEFQLHEPLSSKLEARGTAYLLPLISNREVVALLYCDDRRSTSEDDLHTLSLFVSQASLALENRFLRRRLNTFRDNLEEQTEVARS